MRLVELARAIRSRDFRIALSVAITADALQIIALPLFASGGLSPADTAIDVAAALILSRVLGWHWAFLPTMFAELLPAFDLFPTWTAAVLYVTWQRRQHTLTSA
jgi:hypothetical protein